MLTEALIVLVLILFNGVFAGAEIAILSLRKTRLAELVEEGSGAARAVARLRESPEGFLATVQIGITVVGATAAAFSGASLAERLAPAIAAVPVLERWAEQIALGIVVSGVSFLSLVLGELVPKSLALRAGETYALLISRPLAGLAWAATPVVKVLTGASNLVLRAFGDSTSFTESRLSREELQQIVDEAATTGSLDPHAGEIASRALAFEGLDAYTLMVPRHDVVMVPLQATVSELARLSAERGHARVPVYDGNPDNVVGFVNVRDLLAAFALEPGTTLQAHLHPPLFVPDSIRAPALLRRLQEERTHLALVIDEQGILMGLVTVEDLLEEIVGEILSENDLPTVDLRKEPDGAWIAAGDVAVHVLERETSIELPEGEYATVAGLVLALAGRMPKVGCVVEVPEAGVSLEVVEATPRRVKVVRIRRKPAA